MATIKIKDDNSKTTTSIFTGYSLEPLEEEIVLEVYYTNGSAKYSIHSDDREPNMYNIETFISNYFDNVLTNNLTGYIYEYLRREYISIGEEDHRQFYCSKEIDFNQ